MVFEEFKPAAAGIGLIVLAIVLISISKISMWKDTSLWLKLIMIVLAPIVAYLVVDFKSD